MPAWKSFEPERILVGPLTADFASHVTGRAQAAKHAVDPELDLALAIVVDLDLRGRPGSPLGSDS